MAEQIELMIIDNLIQEIVQGKYKANDQFPSENELADHYGVPRIKVRNAFLKLEDMGYLYSKQGKGRFLKPKQRQIELHLTGSSSFSEKMKQAGYDLKTQNLGCEKIVYDPKIYACLNVEQNDDVYKISRLRIIDGLPIALHVSYVAKSVFPQIESDGAYIQSMFAYYEEKGFTSFLSSKSNVSISFPTNVERSLFDCAPLVPLFVLQSDCIDANQHTVLEYTKIIYRSDSFTYVITAE
ncbi:GntR family transcriptional regulator [Cytobacillus depressus]|uniref:GntR family transcriptional regulator n=1 Tax=Cytobacillus depressus TaxID=1602942 RepID=A0A6L3UYQ1_9BACI|nr:GntR family transcriptional regulator [Cytobacillus depressus]KAB2329386.1 GntR family transcriptional regulator [Cytobacillus depressus]